jgi:hypothetical protein
MAKGWNRVEQEAAEARARQEQWAKQQQPRLFLSDGESATVRFLEQDGDIHHYHRHEYMASTSKGQQRRQFTCLNDNEDGTRCPGCEAGLKLKTRGCFNVIQRQRPILRKGQDGKAMKDSSNNYIVDGHADAVVIWDCPSTTLDLLRQKDSSYHGLMSRDLVISRTGTQFSPFVIEPADIDSGAVEMTPEDYDLAKDKFDLDEFMAPPTFSEAAKLCAGQAQQAPPQGQQTGTADGPAQPAVDPENVFTKARQEQGQ